MTVREVTIEVMRGRGRSDAHIETMLRHCIRSSGFFQNEIDMELDDESAELLRTMLAATFKMPASVVHVAYERFQKEEREKN